MKLYTNAASPFARKCRVVAFELDLALEEIRTLPFNDPDFRRVNPLGKIPALVLDDGSVLIDSPVICEYLNNKGGGKFFPGMNLFKDSSGRGRRWGCRRWATAWADAAVAYVVEGRQATPNEATRTRHMDAVTATLDVFERVKFAEPPTIGEVSVACALGYLDFRIPGLDGKPPAPKLSAWYARMCAYPAMQATAPAAP